jgi:hypothetical protein
LWHEEEWWVEDSLLEEWDGGEEAGEQVHARHHLDARHLVLLKAGLRIHIHLIRIRIQHFRLNTDPDPGVLMTSKHKLSWFFILLWVNFAFLDPDTASEYGSGSTDPIKSGSNWDPDPHPCPKRSVPFHSNPDPRICNTRSRILPKLLRSRKTVEIKFVYFFFACWWKDPDPYQ